jgi:hypothetical protein
VKIAIALVKLGLGCHAAVTSCIWLVIGRLLPLSVDLLRWRQLHFWTTCTAQSHRRCGSSSVLRVSFSHQA